MTSGYMLIAGCTSALLLAACGSKPAEAPAADPASPTASPPAQVQPPAPEAVVAPVNFADLTGDAVAGKRIFIQCQACHSMKEDENRVGPSLYGIVGATAAHLPDFRYSEANKGSGIVWTEEKLFDYLKNPRAMVPGTTMAFAGIADPQKRADVVAFLKANGAVG